MTRSPRDTAARLAILGLALGLATPSLAQTPAPGPATPAATAKPAPALPMANCQARFAVIGLPRHRGDDAAARQKLACLPGYAASYNTETRQPDWVIHRLTPGALKGPAERKNQFLRYDPIPQSPGGGDYVDKANPRDRGHQAPAADFKSSQDLSNASFYMINMSPQVGPRFNRGQWRYLEEDVRAAVLCGGHADVIVMTGPIYGASALWIGPKTDGKILSPAAYFKILYDVGSGRAVGFRLENKGYDKTPLDTFIVPIAQLEDETGLDFMGALPRRTQNQIETSKGAYWGHGQSCSNGG